MTSIPTIAQTPESKSKKKTTPVQRVIYSLHKNKQRYYNRLLKENNVNNNKIRIN